MQSHKKFSFGKLIIIGTAGMSGTLGLFFGRTLCPLSSYLLCRPTEVPLPNGYSYSPDASVHLILTRKINESNSRIVGDFAFVSRIDVYHQYVVGEVTPSTNNHDGEQFNYFIINTQTGASSGEVSKAVYERQIKTLNLTNKVKLQERSAEWRKKMCFTYG